MDIVWQAEDCLREKKVESDLKDLLKTMVAFANSVAPGDTAQIFIGEKDDGTVQGVTNADSIQKRVKREADEIYPEIYYRSEVYEREGKQCVRVAIKHNGLAPHFGGAAWVRKGSETVKATEQVYQQMVELRVETNRLLSQWLNKQVTVEYERTSQLVTELQLAHDRVYRDAATLTYVGLHWVTISIPMMGDKTRERSEPVEKLLLSWDDEKSRLKLVVT
jgi:predicted HTH transcriptional regulator